MKSLTTTILAVFTAFTLFAQFPQSFKYQALVLNNAGEIIPDQIMIKE